MRRLAFYFLARCRISECAFAPHVVECCSRRDRFRPREQSASSSESKIGTRRSQNECERTPTHGKRESRVQPGKRGGYTAPPLSSVRRRPYEFHHFNEEA